MINDIKKKDKLKICFIGWADSIHVQRWVKWFARQGHEVHLIESTNLVSGGLLLQTCVTKLVHIVAPSLYFHG